MKTIYCIRHCSATGQHKDSPLTTEGTRQAQLMSMYLNEAHFPIDKIISSPYLRAIDSIKPYAESKNLKIETDPQLHERVLSIEPVDDWLNELEHSFRNLNYRLPGGESSNDAIQRINDSLENIFENDEVSDVALVTHGNLLTLLLSQYDPRFNFEKWKRLQNPDIYLLHYDHGVQSIEHLWNLES